MEPLHVEVGGPGKQCKWEKYEAKTRSGQNPVDASSGSPVKLVVGTDHRSLLMGVDTHNNPVNLSFIIPSI